MIPKRIFQIAIGQGYIARLPLSRLRDTLLSLNPGYEYTFLDDAACLEFLESHFPQYISAFMAFSRPQYKSDFIRYLYAYVFGGFYVDIDLLPTLGFDDLIQEIQNPPSFFTIGAHKNSAGEYNELANGFFGTEKENPLFLCLINLMIAEPNPADYGMNVKRVYRELSKIHSMKPFSQENGLYLVQELGPIQSRYHIYGSPTRHICFSNGSGYPFIIPK
jgi:hypothetical protein